MNCDGTCINDADGDGVCDENEVLGCTLEVACNYNLIADNDGGPTLRQIPCVAQRKLDECGVCGGDGIADGA